MASSVKPNKSMLTRILVVMLAMVIFTVSVTGFRLVWLMIVEGEKYQSKAVLFIVVSVCQTSLKTVKKKIVSVMKKWYGFFSSALFQQWNSFNGSVIF